MQSSVDRADTAQFIKLINDPSDRVRGFFNTEPIFISRAPGRLDVMGGIADYSGSLVLEMPIAEATFAAVQKSDDEQITIISLASDGDEDRKFEMPLSAFGTAAPIEYEAAHEIFISNTSDHWASYVAGIFLVLMREREIAFNYGARILISSNIPLGKGVSSSAALETAVMQAVCSAFNIEIEPLDMALLCQKVENLVVGAPCGVMDQITSNCGSEGSLLSLLCQPAEIKGKIPIPKGLSFWGIDSGVRHAVTGSDYSSLRVGAFIGYRIIAELSGQKFRIVSDGVVEIEDDPLRGYLANISPADYERFLRSAIPETILGETFLRSLQGITDTVTRVDPSKTYSVRVATEFPIYENARVKRFSSLIDRATSEADLYELGQMMFASHAGYVACGLTESGTERLVELVHSARGVGLYGARITGGGSGGTVAILGRSDAASAVESIAARYKAETRRTPYVFRGSSKGCAEFGCMKFIPLSAR